MGHKRLRTTATKLAANVELLNVLSRRLPFYRHSLEYACQSNKVVTAFVLARSTTASCQLSRLARSYDSAAVVLMFRNWCQMVISFSGNSYLRTAPF